MFENILNPQIVKAPKEDGGPAFPSMWRTQINDKGLCGMSLRDYFAAAALQGMLAADSEQSFIRFEKKAPLAYEYADSMLAERLK